MTIFSTKSIVKTRGLVSADFLPEFDHINALSLEEASSLLVKYGGGAAAIAGGTDLLRLLKNRVLPFSPRLLVNLKTIAGMDYITEDSAGLRIGAMTKLSRIELNDSIKAKYGILARAAHLSGVTQHRNMASLGGSLCRQVSCWYFRASGNAFFCRKGGDKCYATEGNNRYHAIYDNDVCCAVNPSDVVTALAALGASVKIYGRERFETGLNPLIPPAKGLHSSTLSTANNFDNNAHTVVPLEKFFTPTGNILQPGQLITDILVPAPQPNQKSVFLKTGSRNKFDAALASVAVSAIVEDGLCRSARIVLGGVSPMPYVAFAAGETLRGYRITGETAIKAARRAVEDAAPLSKNGYKVELIQTLIKRALAGLVQVS